MRTYYLNYSQREPSALSRGAAERAADGTRQSTIPARRRHERKKRWSGPGGPLLSACLLPWQLPTTTRCTKHMFAVLLDRSPNPVIPSSIVPPCTFPDFPTLFSAPYLPVSIFVSRIIFLFVPSARLAIVKNSCKISSLWSTKYGNLRSIHSFTLCIITRRY